MTFYEAALRVLEGVGHPLHNTEITQQSISQNLLSHVGKTPDQTMLSRLAAIARRTRDRRIVVTAKDTFALAEWSVPEDPEALAQTGIAEPNPEEDLPPLRMTERHPEPRNDNIRTLGRTERKRKDREEDDTRAPRKRRFPPMTEVAFDILSETSDPLTAAEIVERAQAKGLAGDLGAERLAQALLDDNHRRADSGRRAVFVHATETGHFSIDREAPPLAAAVEAEGSVDSSFALKAAVRDARHAFAKSVLRRFSTLEAGTFEKTIVKMLLALGFRELKVAKRFSSAIVYTSRKREGSLDVRYAIRIVLASGAVDRKAVQEFRRDIAHRGSQMGLMISAGEVRGDGRAEAVGAGSIVWLWCAEALAEKLLESQVGLKVTYLESFDLDEAFFERMAQEAADAQQRREERTRERNQTVDSSEVLAAVETMPQPSESAPSLASDPERKRRRRRRRGGRKLIGPVTEAQANANASSAASSVNESDSEPALEPNDDEKTDPGPGASEA